MRAPCWPLREGFEAEHFALAIKGASLCAPAPRHAAHVHAARRSSSSTDERHQLNAVALADARVGMLLAGDQLVIEFDGDSAVSEAEVLHQVGQGGAAGNVYLLTIDHDQHGRES